MKQYFPFLSLSVAWLLGVVALSPSTNAAGASSGWIVNDLHKPRGVFEKWDESLRVVQCEWSADHKALALGYSDGAIGFFDPLTKTMKLVDRVLRKGNEDKLKWRPDGTLIAFGDSGAKVINPRTGKVAMLKTALQESDVIISPDCKLVLTRGYGFEPLSVIDVASGKQIFSNGPQKMMPRGMYARQIMQWSPDSTVFVATRNHALHLYKPGSSQPMSGYDCPEDFSFEFARWLRNGTLFLSGHEHQTRAILKFDTSGGQLRFKQRISVPSEAPQKEHSYNSTPIVMDALDAEGKTLTVSTQDRVSDKLRFWNSVSNRKIVAEDDHEPIFNATSYLSPDGGCFALSHFNTGIVSVFDTRTGRKILSVLQKGAGDEANVDVFWAPDSRALAIVGTNGSLQMCYLESPRSRM